MIDLRSDTITKPTSAMLDAMQKASVGDDVYGEDPTVHQLEKMTADLFSMESALFCPSGTMANQIAIKCHTNPGDEVICDKMSHIYQYEGGGIAFNSGCQVKLIEGNFGKINASQVENQLNPKDVHKSNTSLVSVENTSNRGGGSCYEINDLQDIKAICQKNNIGFHLDGARLWNAMVAKNEEPSAFGQIFNSISVCLSKGLGAPVGSLLLGSTSFIHQARRYRKVLGGGMRQAGYLAAAGIYAIEHHLPKLADDHMHAFMISQALKKKSFVTDLFPVETNIIIFEVNGLYDAPGFCRFLKEHDILCTPITGQQIRMVTHLDVTEKMVEKITEIIEKA